MKIADTYLQNNLTLIAAFYAHQPQHFKLRDFAIYSLSEFKSRLQQSEREQENERCLNNINTLLQHALNEQRHFFGPNSPRLIAPLIRLAYFETWRDHRSVASEYARQAMAIREHDRAPIDIVTAEYFGRVSNFYLDRNPKFAEQLVSQGLEMALQTCSKSDSRLYLILLSTSNYYRQQQQYMESFRYLKWSYAIQHLPCGSHNPDYLLGIASLYTDWGKTEHRREKTTQAEHCYRQAIAHLKFCKMHGQFDLFQAYQDYASYLQGQGRFSEADHNQQLAYHCPGAPVVSVF